MRTVTIKKCQACGGKAKVESETVLDRIVCVECGCATEWYWDNVETVLRNWNNWHRIKKPDSK